MPAMELSNLSKGLMVGQAYVDAYTLESAAKIAGIILTPDVYADIGELDNQFECTEEKAAGESNYIMRYLDYEYLSESNNMQTYVDLAAYANWLPHYYNTLYLAMRAEKNSRKVSALFENIITSIGDTSEYWQGIDKFIKNAFDKDVNPEFQKRFLKYLREQIVVRNGIQNTVITRPTNKERVLKFIEERGNLTISQISSTLNLAPVTVSRIVRSLSDEGIVENSAVKIKTDDSINRSINTYSIKK